MKTKYVAEFYFDEHRIEGMEIYTNEARPTIYTTVPEIGLEIMRVRDITKADYTPTNRKVIWKMLYGYSPVFDEDGNISKDQMRIRYTFAGVE